MAIVINLKGSKFGKLEVIEKCEDSIKTKWVCKCECGNIKNVLAHHLRTGHTKSCGCKKHKKAHNFKDLIGEIRGHLKIIKLDTLRPKSNKRRAFWLCECECGNIRSVASSHLQSGHTTSCGCKKHLKQDKNPKWKGFGDISGTRWDAIKHCAKMRSIKFEITIQYAWKMFQKQNGKCVLSGRELIFNSKSKTFNGNASLDRIDSSKGYIKNNVQWVDKDINIMKQAYSDEFFINVCNEVSLHNRNKKVDIS